MLKIIINQYKSQPHMEEEEVGNQKTRDFICACGKNYLSYAALFTHIKQKHDGKAPGPIVRPRSQRKRGRPRKNPLNDQEGQNSDSDVAKNGISFTNEINNNINIFQKKAKKAAQLLGCGQFQAFQAYRPDMGSGGKPKTQKQEQKNPNLKRCISNNEKSQKNISKDDSISSNEIPDNLKHCKSAPVVKKDSKNDHSSYHYNFVIQHMLDLFQDYQPSQDEYTYKQIIEIFDWIGQQMNSHSKYQRQMANKKLTLQNGFQMFLEQIQDYLQQFEYKQVSFLLSLFYEYICHQLGQPSNTMLLGVQISQFPKYVPQFLNTYLPKKVNQLSVECLYIFKQMNPRTVMMALCNWVSLYQLPQNSYETNTSQMLHPKTKKAQKMIKKISMSESKQPNKYQTQKKSQKMNKIQSQQDDIKFQQFNQIFEKSQRNSKQKEQHKLRTREEDHKQDHSLIKQKQINNAQQCQQCELQSQMDYNSDSNQQQIENSSQSCVDKNQEKQGKVVVGHR